jgi:hypothetical protein
MIGVGEVRRGSADDRPYSQRRTDPDADVEGAIRVRLRVSELPAERSHQTRGNVPLPVARVDDAVPQRVAPFPSGEVVCRERFGGLLKHYHRKALPRKDSNLRPAG